MYCKSPTYNSFILLHSNHPFAFLSELLANLVVDLAPVKSKCLAFGVQLGLPMDEVQAMEMEHHHNAGIILHHICHHWLSNTPEGVWFQRLCAALERVGNSDLATFVKKKYMASSPGLCDIRASLFNELSFFAWDHNFKNCYLELLHYMLTPHSTSIIFYYL